MSVVRVFSRFFLLLLLTAAIAGYGWAADPPQTGASGQPPAAAPATNPDSSSAAQGAAPAAAANSDASQAAAASDAASSDDQQSSASQSTDQKIQQLQQQVNDLTQQLKTVEQQQELQKVEDAAAAEKAQNQATVTANTSGFTIESPHGNFLLKIGADLQVDNRTFFGANFTNPMDQMLLRRVRPTFSGTIYKYIDYFFRPDFGQGSVIIYDAYVELRYFDFAKVRAGKFKPPVSLERLQSDDDTTFVERGLPTMLAPSRDIGYQVSGDLLPRHISYTVGAFNGVPDNGLSDASVSDHRDFAGRLFVNLFNPEVANLGFGVGASSGSVDAEALPSYKTFGQNSFFTFASGVTEGGHRTRLQPGLYYYMRGFGLLTEYGLTEEDLQKGTFRTDIAFRAWQAAGSYILTGEKKSWASPTPKHSFDPLHGGWGAVEVALRTGEFTADRALFNDGFASLTVTPRLAHEVVGGVNWYLNRLFRISGDYGRTNFGGGATTAQGINRPVEKVLIFRFQINFI